MIELFENEKRDENRKSSKGNQLKWFRDNKWHKADYTGYEGLSEYIISHLLKNSSLNESEFVSYCTEEIKYKRATYTGCYSDNFLKDGKQLITLERLYSNHTGKSLYKEIYKMQDINARLDHLVTQVERITGLEDFGIYLSKLLTIDAVFLNEDRHMHNIAVIMDKNGSFEYSPIFDNGAGLLSDIKVDYPLGENLYELIDSVSAKTIDSSFEKQLDAAEKMYGYNIKFNFNKNDVKDLLEADSVYGIEIKERVYDCICEQMRKYKYLITH